MVAADVVAADVVAELADADVVVAADAEDVEAGAGAHGAVAAVAAAEAGVCLGVGADPGAKRQRRSLKSAIVGAGRNIRPLVYCAQSVRHAMVRW